MRNAGGNMNILKFSHDYHKFPFQLGDMDRVVLLEVLIADTKDLHESFIKYDTEIQIHQDPASDNIVPMKYYKLPSGKVIILILKVTHLIWDILKESNAIFTTIRRWTPEKERYYKSIRGQEVKIEVKE